MSGSRIFNKNNNLIDGSWQIKHSVHVQESLQEITGTIEIINTLFLSPPKSQSTKGEISSGVNQESKRNSIVPSQDKMVTKFKFKDCLIPEFDPSQDIFETSQSSNLHSSQEIFETDKVVEKVNDEVSFVNTKEINPITDIGFENMCCKKKKLCLNSTQSKRKRRLMSTRSSSIESNTQVKLSPPTKRRSKLMDLETENLSLLENLSFSSVDEMNEVEVKCGGKPMKWNVYTQEKDSSIKSKDTSSCVDFLGLKSRTSEEKKSIIKPKVLKSNIGKFTIEDSSSKKLKLKIGSNQEARTGTWIESPQKKSSNVSAEVPGKMNKSEMDGDIEDIWGKIVQLCQFICESEKSHTTKQQTVSAEVPGKMNKSEMDGDIEDIWGKIVQLCQFICESEKSHTTKQQTVSAEVPGKMNKSEMDGDIEDIWGKIVQLCQFICESEKSHTTKQQTVSAEVPGKMNKSEMDGDIEDIWGKIVQLCQFICESEKSHTTKQQTVSAEVPGKMNKSEMDGDIEKKTSKTKNPSKLLVKNGRVKKKKTQQKSQMIAEPSDLSEECDISWTPELEGALVHSLLKKAQVDDIEDLRHAKINYEVWRKVVSKLDLPVEKVIDHWKYNLYPQLFAQQPVVLRRDLQIELIKWLYNSNIEEYNQLNWKDISRRSGDLGSCYLYRVFREMVGHNVPKEFHKNLRDTVMYLHEYLIPKLKKKSYKGDVKTHMLIHKVYNPNTRKLVVFEVDEADFVPFRIQ